MKVRTYSQAKSVFNMYIKCGDKPIVLYGPPSGKSTLVKECISVEDTDKYKIIHENVNVNDFSRDKNVIIVINDLDKLKDVTASKYYLIDMLLISKKLMEWYDSFEDKTNVNLGNWEGWKE